MNVPVRLAWTGADPISGVAGYDVWIIGPTHNPPDKVANQISSKHYDFAATN